MDRCETTEFFHLVWSTQTELEHSKCVAVAFLKWSRCRFLASQVTCWALQTLRAIFSYYFMCRCSNTPRWLWLSQFRQYLPGCFHPFLTTLEADCVISLGHGQRQPRALRLGQVRGWGVRDPGGRGVWEWAAPGGVSTGLALPWALPWAHTAASSWAVVGAHAATGSRGSGAVGWTFGLDPGAHEAGTAAPCCRRGAVLGGSHLDQLHTSAKGGKRQSLFLLVSIQKKRSNFAHLGHVLTMSPYQRLEAVALLHVLYLAETFFSPTLSISLCSS